MPNWCQNEITISGDEKKVKEFIKFVSSKKSKFDFNKIYPMPKELEGTVSGSENLKSDEQKANSKLWKIEYGADNWYDWRNLHWGTKLELNPDYVEVEFGKHLDPGYVEGDYVTYCFDTAWSPPLGILEALNRKFHFKKNDDLGIQWHYREDGMGFTGYLEDELED
mgnify:CR=1 FL=1